MPLKTPHPGLSLERVADMDTNSLSTYRLNRLSSPGIDEEMVLEFLAPQDSDAEEMADAWYKQTKLQISPWRYAWYNKILEVAESRKKEWQGSGYVGEVEMEKILDAYLTAEHSGHLLQSAFVGRWPDDPRRKTLK